MTTTIPKSRWGDLLNEFTDRNAGRRAILEVDDLSLGAQSAVDYPLWGISYDPGSDQVEVMFSDFRDVRSHLTHNIRDAASIELLHEAGQDEVLRIQHQGGGQTLIRLVSPVAS